MREEMQTAASALEFEKAAQLRDEHGLVTFDHAVEILPFLYLGQNLTLSFHLQPLSPAALENARADLVRAQKDYDSLHDASLSEDTAGVRAALANAEVRAPFPGTVTNIDLKVGEFAGAGTPVVTIADLSKWVVKTTDLTEIDVVNIEEGEPVTVTLDAMPSVELKGNVLSIAQNFSEKQGDIVYEVTILLTTADAGMRWGMTAQVNFPR